MNTDGIDYKFAMARWGHLPNVLFRAECEECHQYHRTLKDCPGCKKLICRSCHWNHNPTDGSLGCQQSKER